MPEENTSASSAASTAAAPVASAPATVPSAAAAPSATQTAPQAPQQETLTAFCTRISRTDRRVEFIAAFFHAMNAEKKVFDTVENWRIALAEFEKKPA